VPSEPHKENCSVRLPAAPSESFVAYHVKVEIIEGRENLMDAEKEHSPTIPSTGLEPTKEYNCSKCGKKLKQASHLYAHYSSAHFKKEILAKCGGFVKKTCPLCGTSKACDTESKLAIHLGIRHKMVDLFLEPQFQVPRYVNHRKQNYKVRDMDSFLAPQGHSATYPPLRKQHWYGRFITTQEEPEFCSICGQEERSWNALYRHYSINHFAQQIADTCGGQMSGQCQLCPKFCKSERSFLSHQA
jgi:hypothetical protein